MRSPRVAFAPDGGRLASASQDGHGPPLGPGRGATTDVLAGHDAGVTALAIGPGGTVIASAGAGPHRPRLGPGDRRGTRRSFSRSELEVKGPTRRPPAELDAPGGRRSLVAPPEPSSPPDRGYDGFGRQPVLNRTNAADADAEHFRLGRP